MDARLGMESARDLFPRGDDSRSYRLAKFTTSLQPGYGAITSCFWYELARMDISLEKQYIKPYSWNGILARPHNPPNLQLILTYPRCSDYTGQPAYQALNHCERDYINWPLSDGINTGHGFLLRYCPCFSYSRARYLERTSIERVRLSLRANIRTHKSLNFHCRGKWEKVIGSRKAIVLWSRIT